MLNPADKNEDCTPEIEQSSTESLEDGEITEVPGTVPTPPAKRRKCGRESLLEQARDNKIPSNVLNRSTNIIWVDLEMTGLDIEKDYIMEMACIVTDKHLNVIAEGPNLVINQSEEVLGAMGEWCTQQHGKTGLTKQCLESTLTCEEAERQMIEFISQYCPKGRCELAGNSIHCDRKFIERHMPKFLEWLHYRIIDVSSIRNVCWRWYPNFEKYQSDQPISHRALDDIRSSIEELRYYRQTVFKNKQQYEDDLELNTKQDAFELVLSRCEAIQAKKPPQNGSEWQLRMGAAQNGGSGEEKADIQKPVSVNVNGKSITLFGNQ